MALTMRYPCINRPAGAVVDDQKDRQLLGLVVEVVDPLGNIVGSTADDGTIELDSAITHVQCAVYHRICEIVDLAEHAVVQLVLGPGGRRAEFFSFSTSAASSTVGQRCLGQGQPVLLLLNGILGGQPVGLGPQCGDGLGRLELVQLTGGRLPLHLGVQTRRSLSCILLLAGSSRSRAEPSRLGPPPAPLPAWPSAKRPSPPNSAASA